MGGSSSSHHPPPDMMDHHHQFPDMNVLFKDIHKMIQVPFSVLFTKTLLPFLISYIKVFPKFHHFWQLLTISGTISLYQLPNYSRNLSFFVSCTKWFSKFIPFWYHLPEKSQKLSFYFLQVADDMHRMTDYIMDLRNLTILMFLMSALGELTALEGDSLSIFCFKLIYFWKFDYFGRKRFFQEFSVSSAWGRTRDPSPGRGSALSSETPGSIKKYLKFSIFNLNLA